jgi:hypothetical protein
MNWKEAVLVELTYYSWNLLGGSEVKHEKTSVRIAEIETQLFSNTSPEQYTGIPACSVPLYYGVSVVYLATL